MSDTTRRAVAAPLALKRAIGPKLLFFFVIGDVIGTGIYALIGSVAGQIGGALWLPFLLAFGVAFLTAFSYLELVGKYPRAAGAALYTQRAFRIPFLTFLVAFAVMCSGIASAAAAARAFGATYLQPFVPCPVMPVAVGFLIALGLINFRGVAESVKANAVLTGVELLGLLIIIAIGVYAVGSGQGEPSRLLEIRTADQSLLLSITAATSLAFFAMVGFEDSVNMAEECLDPARIFPRSLLSGLAVAALIYGLVALTASLLVPAEELSAARSDALLKVVAIGAPAFPLKVFAGIGLLAVINSALINMLMASRLLYGMANERILPPVFGAVHPSRRTPWVSILFTTVIAVGLLVAAGEDGVRKLGGTTALLLLCIFTGVNIACLVLRREKVEHTHFRAPTAAPVLGALFCGYLALPVLSGRPASDYVIALALLGVGIALWGINRWWIGRVEVNPEALK
ncbi:APC family permease [Methylocaldum sp.]|uniref:APC family permease n=1 Tax=Methylocaldum sp. TaxID=1969727 RepID=UPI002D3ACC1A|nr:APC family permease [Methylocaldum sp.]HYE34497.1 APC family permease [Methylocaldum sp.]